MKSLLAEIVDGRLILPADAIASAGDRRSHPGAEAQEKQRWERQVSGEKVVLDANVLYGNLSRDLLISLFAEGFYEAKWTDEITDEWVRHPSMFAVRYAAVEPLIRDSHCLAAA